MVYFKPGELVRVSSKGVTNDDKIIYTTGKNNVHTRCLQASLTM